MKVVQISNDQISQAYPNPKINLDSSAVTDLIPFLDKEKESNVPLFKAEDGKIYQYVFFQVARETIHTITF